MTIPTPEDFEDSALDLQTISEVTNNNGFTAATTVNRTGATINTLTGALALLGFQPPVPFAGGIQFLTLADNTKTVEESGNIYAPVPSEIPFTTSGTWIGVDELKFYVVQQTGSGGDATTLNGQPASFYQDADNINAGILDPDRLSGSYGISITGNAATADSATDSGTLGGNTGSYYTNPENSAYISQSYNFATVQNIKATLDRTFNNRGQSKFAAAWVAFNPQTGAILNEHNVSSIILPSPSFCIFDINFDVRLQTVFSVPPFPRLPYVVSGATISTGAGMIHVRCQDPTGWDEDTASISLRDSAGVLQSTGPTAPNFCCVVFFADFSDFT